MTGKTDRQRAKELVAQGLNRVAISKVLDEEGYRLPNGGSLRGKSWAISRLLGYKRPGKRRRRRVKVETVSVGKQMIVRGDAGKLKAVKAILGIEDMPEKDKIAYVELLLS